MTNPTYADRKRWREISLKVKAHDHSFEYSDDHEVWRRGLARRKELIRELSEIPLSVATSIVLRWVPKEFQKPWLKAFYTSP